MADALRDRFVSGVTNHTICKSLLSEDGLTLAKAEKMATAMETAAQGCGRIDTMKPSGRPSHGNEAKGPRNMLSVRKDRTFARKMPLQKRHLPRMRKKWTPTSGVPLKQENGKQENGKTTKTRWTQVSTRTKSGKRARRRRRT